MTMVIRRKFYLFALSASLLAVNHLAYAQTKEETLDFLFRDSSVNNVRFYSWRIGDEYENISNFRTEERGCVVTISATISGSTGTSMGGDPAANFRDQPVQVAIDFNKIITRTAIIKKLSGDNFGKVEIDVSGTPGTVRGSAWLATGHNGTMGLEPRHVVSDNLTILFSEEKSPKASNAFQYFVETFCSGSNRAF
jgi:hypothetical protein